MKILYYFREENTYMYQWQRLHIFDELEQHGHSIEVFNPLSYTATEEANEKLIQYLIDNRKKYDLFMTCHGSEYIHKETIDTIKKLGLPTLLICFDNLHAPFMHKKIAKSFDLVWLTSKETIGMFEKWGCENIIFQTYAANPNKFSPQWNTPIGAVSFIGSPYGSRVNKLNILTQSGIACNVYANSLIDSGNAGNNNDGERTNLQIQKLIKDITYSLSFSIGRKVFYAALLNKYISKKEAILTRNDFLVAHASVSHEDMQMIYSNSSLSLNITELRNTYVLRNPIHKMHLRTFEIPMCGGLQLASYTDELAGYFEDEKEIVLYKSQEEFVDKARFYLDSKNNSLIMGLKKQARLRAESEHTWMNRFNVIFEAVALL